MRTFTHNLSLTLVFALAAPLVACSSAKDTNSRASDSTTAAAQASADSGMQTKIGGMPGMGGMMNGAMMDSMHTHMTTMEGMSGDRMKAMLPAHRQMVADMLSRMGSDMRQMNMQPDAKWTALADSVRSDLVRMPDMSATELRSAMSTHHGRIMRLMDMHRSMMGGSKKP